MIVFLLFLNFKFLFAAPQTEKQLDLVRDSIHKIESELLSNHAQKNSAKIQLEKIKKLIQLQKKEIFYSDRRIQELNISMKSLSDQKQILNDKITEQKTKIYSRLKELNALTNEDAIDANWIQKFDLEHQRELYLSKLSAKEFQVIEQLKQSADEAMALELRMIEEKGKLDYYIQELKEQNGLMQANEEVQKSILLTNRSSHLETLKNLQELKQVEKELGTIIGKIKKESAMPALRSGLVLMKGKIPYPVQGTVLSGFGRSYNSKTNLFTFQKGLTIRSNKDAEVRAVFEGKIAYSGPLKNYGYIVIVEHTGQYYTLYGQLGKISVSEGESIKQGDIVGLASAEPMYFEIRNKNIAVNPMLWLKAKN